MFIILETLEEVIARIESTPGYIFIYKHSATCPTAILAKQQIEKVLKELPETLVIYVHVRDNRQLSNDIAIYFKTTHESPQLLTYKNGILKDVKNHHSITTRFVLHTLQGGWNG